jgi:hypothetical protein
MTTPHFPNISSSRLRQTDCRYVLTLCVVVLWMSAGTTYGAESPTQSQPSGSDARTLNHVFGEEVLASDVRAVHGKCQELDDAAAFDRLADWVLPGTSRSTFRISGEFEATNSINAFRKSEPLDMGVALIAPALDLIETARLLNRLDELRTRVVSSAAPDTTQRYHRATLLFLLHVALQDETAAEQAFDQVIALSMQLDRGSRDARWASVLMLRATMKHPQLRRMVSEYCFSTQVDLLTYVPDLELDVLNDHLRSLSGLVTYFDSGSRGANTFSLPEISNDWLSFSYSDSSTRGLGRPEACWQIDDSQAIKWCGHEMDFLSYRIPLRGDFEIECDFTTTYGEQVSFMLAGTHLQPATDGQSLTVGNFRKSSRNVPLEHHLTKLEQWARYRAVARNGVLTQYINGAAVLSQELPPNHDPWFAIRSWRRSRGKVRDLRITGQPEIPDEVQLITNTSLNGWAPYFEAGFDSTGNWSGHEPRTGDTEIRGRFRPELSGSGVEKLLRYYRPLIEDGVLEFDMYYQSGRSAAYPTLDRVAFILEPAGLRLHHVSDGIHDHTEIDSFNMDDAAVTRRGPATFPLREGDWNHVAMSLQGDVVRLSVNGIVIGKSTLDSSNRRTFGLFHYADLTEARARNVVWRGEWPRQLPALERQSLVRRDDDMIERRIAALPHVLTHDFRNGIPDELFDMNFALESIQQADSGVQLERLDAAGSTELSTCLQLHGDFDIVASFEDLHVEMLEPRWDAGIGLRLIFDSPLMNRSSLFRTTARNASNRRVAAYESSNRPDFTRRAGGGYLVEESTSGRLRYTRIGSVLYAFYSSGDSPHYRLVRELPCVSHPTTVQGLHLELLGEPSVNVRAVWKDLTIRAERISGLPITDSAVIVNRLNERHPQQDKMQIDLATKATNRELLMQTSSQASIRPVTDGLRSVARSFGSTETASTVAFVRASHELDVEAAFRIQDFKTPESITPDSEITLKLLIEPDSEHVKSDLREASLLLRQLSSGKRVLIARVVRSALNGKRTFVPLRTVTVHAPDRLRIAISEGRLLYLYSEEQSETLRAFAEYPIESDVRGSSPVLSTIAYGTDAVSDVTFYSMTVYDSQTPRDAKETGSP